MSKKIISIFFLGSGHEAKDAPNSGNIATDPINNKQNKNIYVLRKTKDNEIKRDSYTVSGPTTCNGILSSRSLINATKPYQTFFKNVIKHEIKQNNNISELEIKIKGHSRGGIFAKRVYEFLQQDNDIKNSNNTKVTFRLPIYLDPYGGPLMNISSENDQIETDGVVVYTVNETRFQRPASLKNAKIVIFTKVAHDRCQFIKPPKDAKDNSIYYLCTSKGEANEDTILRNYKLKEREIIKATKNNSKQKESNKYEDIKKSEQLLKDFKDIKNLRRDYVESHLKLIENNKDITNCLDYLLKDKNIKPSKERKEILFSKLRNISKEAVDNWIKAQKQ